MVRESWCEWRRAVLEMLAHPKNISIVFSTYTNKVALIPRHQICCQCLNTFNLNLFRGGDLQKCTLDGSNSKVPIKKTVWKKFLFFSFSHLSPPRGRL